MSSLDESSSTTHLEEPSKDNRHNSDTQAFISQLNQVRHYLKILMNLKEAELRNSQEEYRLTSEYKNLNENIRTALSQLCNDLVISTQDIIEFIHYWTLAKKSHNLVKFLNTHSLPKALLQLKDLNSFSNFIEVININHRKAKIWVKRALYLRSMTDFIDVLEKSIDFPPFNLIFGFIKNTLQLGTRSLLLVARTHDPYAVEPQKITKGLNAITFIGGTTSVIGLSALAAGGTATGIALAPISLFIYSIVSAGNELVRLFKDFYGLIRDIRKREPKETYRLRIAKRTSRIFYGIAGFTFKVLLAVVAAFAIFNPVMLIASTAVILGLAVTTFILGAASFIFRNKANGLLKKAENKIFGQKLMPASVKEKPEPNKTKKHELETNLETHPEMLKTFDKISKSKMKPSLGYKKENVDPDFIKKQILECARENHLDFSIQEHPINATNFNIIHRTKDAQRKIAEVNCHKTEVEYHLSKFEARKTEAKAGADKDHIHHSYVKHANTVHTVQDHSGHDQHGHEKYVERNIEEYKAEIRVLLLAIQKNNPKNLKLGGGSNQEILLIYRTALSVGLHQITLEQTTEKDLKQLHGDELKELMDWQADLIAGSPKTAESVKPKPGNTHKPSE